MRTVRYYISLCLLSVLSFSVYSQGVSIELSAKWVKGQDLFHEDSTIYYPELMITYRNNTDTNYYFQKVSDSHCGLPMLPYGSLLQYPIEEYLNPNYLKRAQMHVDYSNENYKVLIGDDAFFMRGWIVEHDTVDLEVGHEIELVNDDLADIYLYLNRVVYNNPVPIDENWIYFRAAEITPDRIMDTFKDKFVFLKPNEVVVDSYNLIAFSLVKGSFTFLINTNLPDYVYVGDYWDEKRSRYIQQKKPLPKEVGGYYLYTGNFSSNGLSITFGKKRNSDPEKP